eukprot:gene27453-4754_t
MARDYHHFLKLCGLKDEAGAVDAGLPTREDFSDINVTADTPAEAPPGGRAAHAFRAACDKASSAGIVALALGSNPSPSQEAPVPLSRTTRGKDIARLALTLGSVPVVIPMYSSLF